MDKIILGVILALGGILVVTVAWNLGRVTVSHDCQRDGFFWQSGERYDCKPSKLPHQ